MITSQLSPIAEEIRKFRILKGHQDRCEIEYPVELIFKILDLIKSGEDINQVSSVLGIQKKLIQSWVSEVASKNPKYFVKELVLSDAVVSAPVTGVSNKDSAWIHLPKSVKIEIPLSEMGREIILAFIRGQENGL
jgi:hypothetical protein